MSSNYFERDMPSPIRDDMLSPSKSGIMDLDNEPPHYEEGLSEHQRDLDFIKFKAQQREFLQRKLHIQKKVESLQREYQFISKLNTDDVTYIMDRKKEQAAMQIQKAFRAKQLTKKQKMAEELKRLGIKIESDVLTPEEMKEIENRKRELKRLREKVDEKRPDRFFEPIDEERKKELNEKVIQKKKLYNNTDMLKKDLVAVDEKFSNEFGDFMSKFAYFDQQRVGASKNLKEIEVMQDYLQRKEDINIRNITVWSQIADNFTVPDLERVRKEHLDKLERYRNR